MPKSSPIKRHGGLRIISPQLACAIGMTANHEGQKLEQSIETWCETPKLSPRNMILIEKVVRYHQELQRRK